MSRLRPWWPVVAWAALMSTLSTDAFSDAHTSQAVYPLLRWLLPHASDATLELVHLLIRKSAHVFEYFIFSLLLLRAVSAPEREGQRERQGQWKMRWAMAALLIVAVYAGLDEFHQSFVPSRTASGWDALLDTAAAGVAQLAAWLYAMRRGRTARPRV